MTPPFSRITGEEYRHRHGRVYDEAVLRRCHILLEDPEGKQGAGGHPRRKLDHVDRYRLEAQRSGPGLPLFSEDRGSTEGRAATATGAEIGAGRQGGAQTGAGAGTRGGTGTGTGARARAGGREIWSEEKIGQGGRRDVRSNVATGHRRHRADQRNLPNQH